MQNLSILDVYYWHFLMYTVSSKSSLLLEAFKNKNLLKMDFFPWKYYIYLITVLPSWNTPSSIPKQMANNKHLEIFSAYSI